MPTNMLATAVPTPIAPPTATLGTPATPFTTGSPYPPPGTSQIFNQVAAALQAVCQNGAGGYGILTGLTLSAGAGLLVNVSTGIGVGDGVLELVASGASGAAPFYQANVPPALALANNAVNFVWLTKTGALVSDVIKTYPAQAKWYLGAVTTVGGAITLIDTTSVMTCSGGQLTRQTGDYGPPLDSPPSTIRFFTKTKSGTYFWDGTAHLPVGGQRMAVIPLSASDLGGGIFSWQNPEGVAVAITAIEFDVQTIAAAACSIDIGTTTVSGTTVSDNLIDGLDIHSATGLFGIQDQAGANGKFRQRLAAGKWVTGSKDTGLSAGLVGFVYIRYFLLN